MCIRDRLSTDPDCVTNLAEDKNHREQATKMESEMTARLQEQGDPRMFGQGLLFDEYPIHTDATRNFYERFMNGSLDASATRWVNETDFEPEPLPQPSPRKP